MKTYLQFKTVVSCLILLLFFSCSSEYGGDSGDVNKPDVSTVVPPGQVLRSFDSRYPTAYQVVWSLVSGNYVADFNFNSRQTSSWFSDQGDWLLEKLAVPYNQIEPVVSKALLQTSYGRWDVDDSYILDRKDFTPIYCVCVTNKSTLSNIYFTVYGDFIKVIGDVNYRTDIPVTVPPTILKELNRLFESPEIVDISMVDIVYSEVSAGVVESMQLKTAIFTRGYEWIVNFWDLTGQTMPEAVLTGFKNSIYALDPVLRMRAMQTETGTTFLFYLNHEGKTIVAEYNAKGQLITVVTRNHVLAKQILMNI
ncbi:hypothetical protein AGMMS49574_21000 [Bacteroidia bacterium]|nr:hypothetical protein AGMMS49574_21000 [Bacteroidia bacterium]